MFPTGDQGFLNSYYAGFANAHVFEPDMPQEVLNSRPVPEMERLSTLYNADVGLYMLANKVSLSNNIYWLSPRLPPPSFSLGLFVLTIPWKIRV